MGPELARPFPMILGRRCHSQIYLSNAFAASRLYVTGPEANKALRAAYVTNRKMTARKSLDTVDFRIYYKLSQASRGFPKNVSLGIARNIGLVVKQVGGPLEEEAYVPEDQYVEEEEENDSAMSEEALKPLPPELQPVPIDDNLPQGDSRYAIIEFDSNYDSYDCFNNASLEDFDWAQDWNDYGPSSDETLEPLNAFGLGESPVLHITPPSGQPQPNNNDAAEGTTQYYDQVDSSESRPNPSTEEGPTLHAPELAPGLLIYSLTTPATASRKPKANFLKLTKRYAFLTSIDEYTGFTAYKHRTSDSRWLVVQEFSETDDFDPGWMALKKKQAKHFWWKNGWVNTSLSFYALEGSRKRD